MRSYLATRIAALARPIPTIPTASARAGRAPRSLATRPRFGSWVVAVALAGSPSALASPAAQFSQPTATNVEAVYSMGHTFITWNEIPSTWGAPYSDETYAVYVSDQPITDVSNATRIVFNGGIDVIPQNSSRFYADLVPDVVEYCVFGGCCDDFVKRHTGRLWVRDANDEARKLANGEGVLVLTPDSAGMRYYAVTVIPAGGNEYTYLSSQNTSCAVDESVEDPVPILLTEKAQLCTDNDVQVYLQYMNPLDWNVTLDAPSRLNCYYGLTDPPTSNRMAKAIQYAYTYEVAIPDETEFPPPWPATVVLHGRGGVQADCTVADQGSVLIRPYDYMGTQWSGCSRMYDYRTADPDLVPAPVYPVPPDKIVNYTEQRVLRALYDTCRLEPIDLERLYVRGHSMGGGGALGMALHYPKVFAAAHSSKPPTAFGDMETFGACPMPDCYASGAGAFNFIPFLWGDFMEPECERLLNEAYLTLPQSGFAGTWDDVLEYYAVNYPEGFNVYQWQDHREQMEAARGAPICNGVYEAPFIDRRFDDMVPFGVYHSYDDPIVAYCLQAHPLYAKLNTGLRSAAAEYLAEGAHVNQTVFVPGKPIQYPPELTYSFSFGMPPPLTADAFEVPFQGHTVVLSETVPGLRVVGAGQPAEPCSEEAAGTLLRNIDWESSWHTLTNIVAEPPTESSSQTVRWEMFFDNLNSVPITVDITPRRLQNFVPAQTDTYTAEVYYIPDGSTSPHLLSPAPDLSVETAPDGRLLLIVEGLTLDADKTYRVRILKP
jgi:pimeloyl-ACP methyl ester carboxylesterase